MEKLTQDLFQDPKVEETKTRIAGCYTSPFSGSRCITGGGADAWNDASP